MTTQKPLVKGISCHAWNKGQSQLAFAPNGDNVYIYETPGRDSTKWKQGQVLSEHGGFVSCIDWSPVTNRIVTCGHDRNAYVWEYDSKDKEWRPTLVILRINRAATSAKWAPSGDKFAVTSGAKCVPICHYEESSHWWISKMIKGHKSTVLSIAWCPNSKFVVTGATDFKARIFSAYIEGIDKKEEDGFADVFPKQYEFGECLAEFDQTKAWVSAVAWSPNKLRIAFAGHGSTVHFVQIPPKGGDKWEASSTHVQTLNEKNLPHLDLQFVDDNTLVAAGFDMNPAVYVSESATEAKWKFKENLDKLDKKRDDKKTGFAGTRSAFQATDSRGVAFGGEDDDFVPTKHENVITNICVIGNGEITTAGLDGRILYWKVK